MNARVWIEAHQFALAPLEDEMPIPDWADATDDPPLAAPTTTRNGVVVMTGVAIGHVLVSTAPVAPPAAEWSEHTEVLIDVNGPLVITTPGEDTIAVFTPVVAGRHAVSVWANGRSESWDLSLDPDSRDNLEQYLVVLTPAGPETGVG